MAELSEGRILIVEGCETIYWKPPTVAPEGEQRHVLVLGAGGLVDAVLFVPDDGLPSWTKWWAELPKGPQP